MLAVAVRRWCEAITSASETGRIVPRGASISRSPDRAMPTTSRKASSAAYCSKSILRCSNFAGPELLQVAVILDPLRPDLQRPALLVGDEEAVVGRLVVLQQAPQRGRGRDADVGHEQDARGDLAAVGLAALADEQVVGRQLGPLLLRPLDAAEGVRQAVALALPEQRLDQARQVARVRGQAPRLEPVLGDLLLDLAVDRRVDRGLDRRSE